RHGGLRRRSFQVPGFNPRDRVHPDASTVNSGLEFLRHLHGLGGKYPRSTEFASPVYRRRFQEHEYQRFSPADTEDSRIRIDSQNRSMSTSTASRGQASR